MAAISAPILTNVAANVKLWRKRRGLRQADLAERADLELRQLQRIERAKANFGIVYLAKLADALEVTAASLLRRATLPAAQRGRPKTKNR